MSQATYHFVAGYRLETPSWWTDYTDDQRSAMCNGMGVDAMGEPLRKAIDHATGFRPAADVHDPEWYVASMLLGMDVIDFAEYDFRLFASNRRFWRNCLAIIDQDGDTLWSHPVAHLRRRAKARICYRAVTVGAAVARRRAREIHTQPARREDVKWQNTRY